MQQPGKSTSLGRVGAIFGLGISLLATSAAQSGYQVTQGNVNTADSGGNAGPVRMARIAMIQGRVSWRTDTGSDWSAAATNLPLRQGAEVWVNGGGKAEIQFDDGSRLRLGNGTTVILQTLYSDDKGEFTELKLNSGLASLTMVTKLSVFQIDTPTTSLKGEGPAYIRVGVSKGVEVAVRRGTIRLEGSQGSAALKMGDYVNVANTTDPYQVTSVPPEDNWDHYCDNRDASYSHVSQYVPSNVALMSDNLDDYGDWRPDPQYGHVWCPRHTNAGWRPYHDGHWTWVDPFGWTWVGDESWGWAPYHYGSWVHASYGWGWAPGPAQQYWSPAVVSFSSYGGAVAWVPLAPYEVRYPAGISFGFQSGNWALSFSIGGAAAYYGGGGDYVVGRPWSNGYINRSYNVYNVNRINNYYGNAGFNSRFVPAYGRSAFAITRTTNAGFLAGHRFQAGTAADAAIFRRGQSFATARSGVAAFGPAGVRPTRAAFTPNRSFGAARPPAAVLNRPVFRSAVAANMARGSRNFGAVRPVSARPANLVRIPAIRGSVRTATADPRAAAAARANVARARVANRANVARANVARANAAHANIARANQITRAHVATTNHIGRANVARTNAVAHSRAVAARTTHAAAAVNHNRSKGAARLNIARSHAAARVNNNRATHVARSSVNRPANRQTHVSRPASRTNYRPQASRPQRQVQRSRPAARAVQRRQSTPRMQPRQPAPRPMRQSAPARSAPPRSAPPRSAPPRTGGGNNNRKHGG